MAEDVFGRPAPSPEELEASQQRVREDYEHACEGRLLDMPHPFPDIRQQLTDNMIKDILEELARGTLF